MFKVCKNVENKFGTLGRPESYLKNQARIFSDLHEYEMLGFAHRNFNKAGAVN